MNQSRFVQTTFWKCIGFLLALPLMGAAQTYTITDLGDLGGSGSGARGINASGQVTGYIATQRGGSSPFLYSDGKMTSLGTLGGGSGIGQAYIPGGIGADAFLYENGVMKDLGTITSPTGGNGQYAYGLGINNEGVVVGESTYQEN